MDDFLYNVRSGNIRRMDKNRRNYSNQNGQEWHGNRKNSHNNGKTAEQVKNYLSENMPALNSLLEGGTVILERMADALERSAAAEERKAAALEDIALAMAKSAGVEDLVRQKLKESNQPQETETVTEAPAEEDEPAAVQVAEEKEKKNHRPATQNRSKIMETITRLRNSDLSYTQIAERLEQEKIPTLSGRGSWHASTVANLLK